MTFQDAPQLRPLQKHLEMPTRAEFEPGNLKQLNARNYKWGAPRPRLKPDDPRLPQRAPPPHVPDATDNHKVSSPGANTRKRCFLSPAFISRAEDTTLDSEVSSATKKKKTKNVIQPASFLGFPLEIRDKIYRELLQNDKPVQVYDGWTKIRKTSRQYKRPSLSPAILRVCRQTFFEGTSILYSVNKFLYLLRDAPTVHAPPPADIEMLAQTDDPRDLDYNEEQRHSRNTEPHIHIAKYSHLFRFIMVEAETNRPDKEMVDWMAQAIRVFTNPLQLGGGDARPIKLKKQGKAKPITLMANIHTLTLRVRPRHSGYDSNGKPTFTFTACFAMGSPVILDIVTLLPQFLHIEVMTRHLNKDRAPAQMFKDLRPARLARSRASSSGQGDMWAQDRVMRQQRQESIHDCELAMRRMEEQVVNFCKQCTDASRGNVTEDMWAWGDIDSDDEWFEATDF